MGVWKQYRCAKCDYTYNGSAGLDFGFVAVTDTFACLDCQTLTDIEIGKSGVINDKILTPITKDEIKLSRKYLKCGHCKSGNIEKWNSKRKPCPVVDCSGKLIVDPLGAVTLWD